MPSDGGASIRIFLPTGDPEGPRIITRSHWTGSAVVCSRAQYSTVRLARHEFSRPGVYVLVGPADSASYDARVYIGEGDVLRERLDEHNKKKDFWTRLVVFSSSDGALNKALIKYIESRLAKLAQSAERAEIDNANVPPQPNLSEWDLADAEAFLHDMVVVFPLVGVTAFEPLSDADGGSNGDLFIRSGLADARARGRGRVRRLQWIEARAHPPVSRRIARSTPGGAPLRRQASPSSRRLVQPLARPHIQVPVVCGSVRLGKRRQWSDSLEDPWRHHSQGYG